MEARFTCAEQLVGNTPLMELSRLAAGEGLSARLLAKLESYNPTGPVKDRAALAMVRDVVDRVVPNPTPEDIRSIKREATDKAVESGASPDTAEVHTEIDPQTPKLPAIAMVSTAVQSAALMK